MGIVVGPMHPLQREYVEPMLRACGSVFSEEEIAVAMQMVRDAFRGDYLILGAAAGAPLAGYCLAGRTLLTCSTWHLYWLCVHPGFRRQGVATALHSTLAGMIRADAGERIVVETSTRADYDQARCFYRSAGYEECGRIADYYRAGDGCIYYCKVL